MTSDTYIDFKLHNFIYIHKLQIFSIEFISKELAHYMYSTK